MRTIGTIWTNGTIIGLFELMGLLGLLGLFELMGLLGLLGLLGIKTFPISLLVQIVLGMAY